MILSPPTVPPRIIIPARSGSKFEESTSVGIGILILLIEALVLFLLVILDITGIYKNNYLDRYFDWIVIKIPLISLLITVVGSVIETRLQKPKRKTKGRHKRKKRI